MHEQGMIHGDLKGVRLVFYHNTGFQAYPQPLYIKANILIDHDCHAKLTDFGLLTIISDPAFATVSSTSFVSGGTIRWMSPELLAPDQFGSEDNRPTKFSDCYALGMVVYEVLSGRVPFDHSRDFIVRRKVIEGSRPERLEGEEGVWFSDRLWETVELCWAHRPDSRPSIETVLGCLKPSLPTVDES